MADRAAWLRQAFLAYHNGSLTADQLAEMVRQHRAGTGPDTANAGFSRQTVVYLTPK